MPPARMRPVRDRDVLTFLIDHGEPDLLTTALGHCDVPTLLALELVSRRTRQAMHRSVLDKVWAKHIPLQVDQWLGTHRNCVQKECFGGRFNKNALVASNAAPRVLYLRSRHATIRLRHVVSSAKTEYKIRTGRNGAIDTLAHFKKAPDNLYSWWLDVREATFDGADIQLCDNSGQTLLHWAVCVGDFKMAHELCKKGLSPTARAKPSGPNGSGHRPVDIVIEGSRIEALLREYTRE